MKFLNSVVSTVVTIMVSSQCVYAADSVNKSNETEISSKSAEEIALKLAPGKVLEVEHEKRSGVGVYAVEIQTSGGLQEITLNAKDGKVISNIKKSKHDNHDEEEEELDK